MRLNKNTKIKPRSKKYQSLDSLEIKPGDRVLYKRVLVTEENKKDRFNVVVYCQRKYNNKQLPNPWYLLTNLENKEEVIKIFASRGGIEAMFRDCKSGGYNLEGSQANAQRLTNLILLIAIAYTASCLVGLKIRNTGHQEYINRASKLKVKIDQDTVIFGRNYMVRHGYFMFITMSITLTRK